MLLALFIFITTHLFWVAQSRSTYYSKSRSSTLKSGPVAATSFAGWHSSNFTLDDLSWDKYNMVFYAAASTTPDVNVIGLLQSDMALIPNFTAKAHEHNVTAVLSIGGWDGSLHFSTAVATDANRTAFAKAILTLVSNYSLDGIDIDWEYPTELGIGCNINSTSDSANLLLFLQKLHQEAPQLILTAAVPLNPFHGSDGKPLSDVSEFAKVLNFIEIMNYDVWGGFSQNVGPNSPLNDSCTAPRDMAGSAVSAVSAWNAAGFPLNKMILGVAAYGHSYLVNQSRAFDKAGNLKLYAYQEKNEQPAGDKWDSTASGVDVCGNPNVVGGVFHFWGLIDAGFLTSAGLSAGGAVTYRFNKCSMTPLVYNSTSEVMVSFDDARSFALKGQFIYNMGLAGFSIWEAGGDKDDILLDAIKSGMDGVKTQD